MTASLRTNLADAILWFHAVVIAFNVFGLVAIPMGAWSGWKFVHVFRWRALHLGLLGIVALQAVLGRACFLTIWEVELLRRDFERAVASGLGQVGDLLASTALDFRSALRGGLLVRTLVVVARSSELPSALARSATP
jgi:hypothetical protein